MPDCPQNVGEICRQELFAPWILVADKYFGTSFQVLAILAELPVLALARQAFVQVELEKGSGMLS